jgi:hypothetical protein
MPRTKIQASEDANQYVKQMSSGFLLLRVGEKHDPPFSDDAYYKGKNIMKHDKRFKKMKE